MMINQQPEVFNYGNADFKDEGKPAAIVTKA